MTHRDATIEEIACYIEQSSLIDMLEIGAKRKRARNNVPPPSTYRIRLTEKGKKTLANNSPTAE